MELRGNHITVAELLADPRSRAVFQRRFGRWMKHPMVRAAQSLTLAQLAEMAAVYLCLLYTSLSGSEDQRTAGGVLLCL